MIESNADSALRGVRTDGQSETFFLDDFGKFYVNGQQVGRVNYVEEDSRIYLREAIIFEPFRKQGYGTKMVATFLNKIKQTQNVYAFPVFSYVEKMNISAGMGFSGYWNLTSFGNQIFFALPVSTKVYNGFPAEITVPEGTGKPAEYILESMGVETKIKEKGRGVLLGITPWGKVVKTNLSVEINPEKTKKGAIVLYSLSEVSREYTNLLKEFV